MKNLWLIIVQTYINIGFRFYFKKIKTNYLEEIPEDKAILFLSNHQNALLDPLIITVNSTRKNYFLTRADVFTNRVISSIFKSLQMIPVYRLRDGIRTIVKNKKVFSSCSNILLQNKSILLFPEGNHSLNRSVRPLSKGFTRIVVDYLSKRGEKEMVIIPVGLNYQSPKEFGDRVSIYFGRSIDPAGFLNSNQVLDIQKLKNSIQNNLNLLTTHIEIDHDYEYTLNKLNGLKVDFTDPVLVNECISNSFQYKGPVVRNPSGLFYLFKFFTILIYSIPYLIWKKIVFPKVVQEEFIGTMRFSVIITIAPVFLLGEAILIAFLFGQIYGFIFLLIGIIVPLIALRVK